MAMLPRLQPSIGISPICEMPLIQTSPIEATFPSLQILGEVRTKVELTNNLLNDGWVVTLILHALQMEPYSYKRYDQKSAWEKIKRRKKNI